MPAESCSLDGGGGGEKRGLFSHRCPGPIAHHCPARRAAGGKGSGLCAPTAALAPLCTVVYLEGRDPFPQPHPGASVQCHFSLHQELGVGVGGEEGIEKEPLCCRRPVVPTPRPKLGSCTWGGGNWQGSFFYFPPPPRVPEKQHCTIALAGSVGSRACLCAWP